MLSDEEEEDDAREPAGMGLQEDLVAPGPGESDVEEGRKKSPGSPRGWSSLLVLTGAEEGECMKLIRRCSGIDGRRLVHTRAFVPRVF